MTLISQCCFQILEKTGCNQKVRAAALTNLLNTSKVYFDLLVLFNTLFLKFHQQKNAGVVICPSYSAGMSGIDFKKQVVTVYRISPTIGPWRQKPTFLTNTALENKSGVTCGKKVFSLRFFKCVCVLACFRFKFIFSKRFSKKLWLIWEVIPWLWRM